MRNYLEWEWNNEPLFEGHRQNSTASMIGPPHTTSSTNFFFKEAQFLSYSNHPVVEIWTSVIDGHSSNRINNSGKDYKIPLFWIAHRTRTTVSRTLSISFLNKNSVTKLTKLFITASLWSAQETNTRRTKYWRILIKFSIFWSTSVKWKANGCQKRSIILMTRNNFCILLTCFDEWYFKKRNIKKIW